MIEFHTGKMNPECKRHKPMSKQLAYVDYWDWYEKKKKRGAKQFQCPICGYWYFKDEY